MDIEDADKLELIQNTCKKIVECTNQYSFANLDDQQVYSLMKLREIAHRVITDEDTRVTENELTSAMCYYINRMADRCKEIVKVVDRILSASLDDQQLHSLLRVKELLCGIIRGAKDVEIEPSNYSYLVGENDLSIVQSIEALTPTKEDMQLGVAQSMMDMIVEDESFQIESGLGNKEMDELHKLNWPANGSITLEWVLEMMSTLEKSSWKNLPSEFRRVVSVDLVNELFDKVGKILHEEPNCVEVELTEEGSRVVVIGDIQGQYHDLLHLLVGANFTSRNQLYVYCGDYVGRGAWGLEVFLTLSAWKILMPDKVFLLRGNHESKHCASACGFEEEVRIKYGEQGEKVYNNCLETFKELPLAAIIAGKVYVTHGGIFRKGSTCPPLMLEGTIEKIVYETSEQTFEMSEKLSETVSDQLSEQMFEHLSQQSPEKTSNQMSEEMSEILSKPTLQKLSDQSSELTNECAETLLEQTSKKVFEQLSDSLLNQQRTLKLEVGSLEELFRIGRYLIDVPSADDDPNIILTDVLWSDPSKEEGLKTNRGRGLGLQWGPDCTEAFLKQNNLKAIIRSHEGPCERDGQHDFCDMLNGCSIDHDGESGKLYTLFSAPDCPQLGKKNFHNEGAYAVLEPPNIEIPTFHTFKAVDRPKVDAYFDSEKGVENGQHQRLLALTDGTPMDILYPASTSESVNFAKLGILNPPQWSVMLSDDESGSRSVEVPKAPVVEGLPLPSNLENPHRAAYEYFLELIAGLKLMVQKRGNQAKDHSPLHKKRKFS